MSIKNKVFAVSMAAAVSVTGFLSVMSAKADFWQEPCFRCGEESLFSEVVETSEEETGTTRLCKHGHEKASDIETERFQKRRYYCRDCDIYWEGWGYVGTFWYCTYDGRYYNE